MRASKRDKGGRVWGALEEVVIRILMMFMTITITQEQEQGESVHKGERREGWRTT